MPSLTVPIHCCLSTYTMVSIPWLGVPFPFSDGMGMYTITLCKDQKRVVGDRKTSLQREKNSSMFLFGMYVLLHLEVGPMEPLFRGRSLPVSILLQGLLGSKIFHSQFKKQLHDFQRFLQGYTLHGKWRQSIAKIVSAEVFITACV